MTEREKVLRAYREFGESSMGRVILDDLERAYVRRPSFLPSHPDPLLTAYREGERALVLKLLALASGRMLEDRVTEEAHE